MTTKKLRVAHMPQVPCELFIVEVTDLNEAKRVSDMLANYDAFQYDNDIKPDYSNATFIEQFCDEENDWVSWSDDETGIDDIDQYFDHLEDIKEAESKHNLKQGIIFKISSTHFDETIQNCENTFEECQSDSIFANEWNAVKKSGSFDELSQFLTAHDIDNESFYIKSHE